MNFSQQLNLIKTLVPSGEVDTRMDCPFCNGTNTLTIKRINSDLLWYCFHASCTAKGNHQGEMTMQQVEKNILEIKKSQGGRKEAPLTRQISKFRFHNHTLAMDS